MLRFLKTVAIALTLASLLPSAPAPAAEPPASATKAPAPATKADQWQADQPGHWRRMSDGNDDRTTSRCIGETTSPVCATETLLACMFRHEDDLCEKVVTDDLPQTDSAVPAYIYTDEYTVKYRLPLVEKVTVGQADAIGRAASRPGDYRVDLQVTYCRIRTNECREDIVPIFNILLRKAGKTWRVVEWDSLPLLQTGETVPGTTLPKEQWMADPPDLWRWMSGRTPQSNTSRCIGQTTSPVCTVETMLNCYQRHDEKLCKTAVLNGDRKNFHENPDNPRGYEGDMKYRLPLVEKVTAGQDDAVDGVASQPGDYLVDLQFAYCGPGPGTCGTDIDQAVHFLLRDVGGDWKIVAWGALKPLKTGVVIPGTLHLQDQWQADPPDRWRVLSLHENVPVTSSCIGETTSPVCAVETHYACITLKELEPCWMSGDPWHADEKPNRRQNDSDYTSYRFPVVRKVERDEMYVQETKTKPGDYVIELEEIACKAVLKTCQSVSGLKDLYLLRKFGNTWEFVPTKVPRQD